MTFNLLFTIQNFFGVSNYGLPFYVTLRDLFYNYSKKYSITSKLLKMTLDHPQSQKVFVQRLLITAYSNFQVWQTWKTKHNCGQDWYHSFFRRHKLVALKPLTRRRGWLSHSLYPTRKWNYIYKPRIIYFCEHFSSSYWLNSATHCINKTKSINAIFCKFLTEINFESEEKCEGRL